MFAEFLVVILDPAGETTDFETWYVDVHWFPFSLLTVHSMHDLATPSLPPKECTDVKQSYAQFKTRQSQLDDVVQNRVPYEVGPVPGTASLDTVSLMASSAANLRHLPMEIWVYIGGFLSSPPDIKHAAAVNRGFALVFIPRLRTVASLTDQTIVYATRKRM